MSHRQALQLALAGVQGPLPADLERLATDFGEAGSPAQRLYQLAGLLTQAERCARALPHRSGPGPEGAAPESLAAPPAALASLLARDQDERNPFVQGDKAELLRARGEHLPFVQLPGWLDYVRTRPLAEREALMACVGERGRWLANLKAEWRPLLADALDDRVWETGALKERCAWLTALRGRDAAAGRAALAAVWASEPPDARERLLACLAAGLSLADQPLLETARSDKRKEIRLLALELLARLPDSAFVQRMLARLAQWLSHAPGGLLRAAKLEVRLPEAYDKAWTLDGIPEKTTRQASGIGDKANWLAETLAYLPLDLVFRHLQIPPASWGRLLQDHDYAAALWAGSVASYTRHPLAALWPVMRMAPMPAQQVEILRAALAAATDAATADDWLALLMQDDFDLAVALPLLPRLPARWSRPLFERLRALIEAQRERPYAWADFLPRFAERVHPELLPEFLAFIDPLGNEPYVRKAVASAAAIAFLRHKLHQHRS